MTTYAAWVAAFQAMTVTSVTRHYDGPPHQVTTADMPAAWPDLGNVSAGSPVTTCDDLRKIRSIQYRIAVNPIAQDNNQPNYDAITPLVDNLETALTALTVLEFINYTLTVSNDIFIGGIQHWGIVADITGSNGPI